MSYDRYERQRRGNAGRSTLGYWVPLAVTVTAATLGLAAWIWSERREEEDDYYDHRPEEKQDRGTRPDDHRPGAGDDDASGGMVARMSGALRRTPSPQQIFDGASKKVAAGVAAAGTVVGGVLSSIREEEKDDYADHSRWSEEAEARRLAEIRKTSETGSRQLAGSSTQTASVVGTSSVPAAAAIPGPVTVPAPTSVVSAGKQKAGPSGYQNVRRKKVAMVISAETNIEGFDGDEHGDQASILSHLPAHLDLSGTQLFVLIYAPEIKQHPLSAPKTHRPAFSATSSFSNIGHEDVYTPREELDKPLVALEPRPLASESSGANTPRTPALSASASSAFRHLYSQALALVEKDTMVMPFTTPSGHVHLLRHLAPEIVYLQESLSGNNGDVVAHISSWVGQVIVVVGADGGHGGLVDSEDEAGGADDKAGTKWWQEADRVGLGKGVEVVEGLHLGEHWGRRVGGKD